MLTRFRDCLTEFLRSQVRVQLHGNPVLFAVLEVQVHVSVGLDERRRPDVSVDETVKSALPIIAIEFQVFRKTHIEAAVGSFLRVQRHDDTIAAAHGWRW